MKIPPAEVVAAVEAGVTTVTRRVAIFEHDGETPWIPEGVSSDVEHSRLISGGGISIDRDRDERRTLDITLDNRDGALRPEPYGGFWYDKVIKAYRGVQYKKDGDIVSWETQVGEFVIDNIRDQNFPHTVKVVGRDYTKRMMLSKFNNSASFTKTTKLGDLIRVLGANSGITKFKIPRNTPNIGRNLDVERGMDRWSTARDAAEAKSYELFFDNEGYLVLKKFADPAYGPIDVTFQTGPEGNLVKYERSVSDSELYNWILVIGDQPSEENDLPYFGQAKNTDPNSPTNIERLGPRVYTYTLSSLESNREAREVARNFLKIAALESFDFTFDAIAYPWLEAGIVAKILEADRIESDPFRYMISSINLPMDLGPMSLVAKRVTIVDDVDDIYVPDEGGEPTPLPIPTPDNPKDPEEEEPDSPEPEPNPGGNTVQVRIATWNCGNNKHAPVVRSLKRLAEEADMIGLQEGADRGPEIEEFLRETRDWRAFRGNNLAKQATTILYRSSLGTVKAKKNYLAHDTKWVGPNGVKPATIKRKYVTRVDIRLDGIGRRITLLNTHMLPSATRTKKYLGEKEWNRRRDHFTKHLSEMTQQIDNRGTLVFVTGDYNATPDFSLLNPLFNRVVLDHTFNTHYQRRIDFVCHRGHNAITVGNKKQISNLASDHDAVVVTYTIKAA